MFRTSTTNVDSTITLEPDVHSVLWGRSIAPVANGDGTYTTTADVADLGDVTSLLLPGATLTTFESDDSFVMLMEHDDWAAILQSWGGHRRQISVRSGSTAMTQRVLARLTSQLPIQEPVPDEISVDFWQLNRQMFTTSRSITAPTWSETTKNYPREVSTSLSNLANTKLDSESGRVILWHGPPGTGKTTAIRSLAGAWQDQARFQIVLDPEIVFSTSTHLMSVILGDGRSRTGWRVLVVEDADHLVGKSQADSRILSRLLNVGDGIVGQGLKVVVLLTTNKSPDDLHPALSRPGRCLAHTYFRRFERSEAMAAFGNDIPDGADFALADLLNEPVDPAQPKGQPAFTGHYL